MWQMAPLLAVCWACVLLAVPAAGAAPVRFFIDEGYFMVGETEILRALVSGSNGSMVISGESTAAFLSVKGYYSPSEWDVYWTSISACHKAFPHMQSRQKVNCIPGAMAITQKKEFVDTWQKAYGEAAFRFIPRSYQLPHQYWLWRSHLAASASPPSTLWVLKANIHRGKGVSILPQPQAIQKAASKDPAGAPILVQSYLNPQMTVAGRSSYIRVWALVTSYSPLRAYLFKGGFAIFGKAKGAAAAAATPSSNTTTTGNSSSSGAAGGEDDLVVNLWMQNRSTSVIWPLDQLCAHFDRHPQDVLQLPSNAQHAHSSSSNTTSSSSSSNTTTTTSNSSSREPASSSSPLNKRRTFDQAWSDMVRTTALALAAAVPSMHLEAGEDQAPDHGPFEYFGLDFVFDGYLQPWLLEVNAVPSMARRKRSNCAGSKSTAACKLTAEGAAAAAAADGFDVQKEAFVHDMLQILGLPVAGAATAAQEVPQLPASLDSSTVNTWLTGLTSWHALYALAEAAQPATQPPPSAAAAAAKPAAVTGSQQQQQQGTAAAAPAARGPARQRRLFDWAPPEVVAPAAPASAGMEAGWAAPQDAHAMRSIKQQQKQQQQGQVQGQQQQGQQQQEQQQGQQQGQRQRQATQQQQQMKQQQGSRRDKAPSSSMSRPHAAARRRHPSHRRHRRHQHDASGATSATAAVPAAAAAAAAAAAKPSQGTSSSSSGKAPAAHLQLLKLPKVWQQLLCPPAQQQQQRPAHNASSSSNKASALHGFGCVRCLLWSDLEALSLLERELSHIGRFTPALDVIEAYKLNQQQGVGGSGSAAAAGGSGGSSGRRGLAGVAGIGRSMQTATTTTTTSRDVSETTTSSAWTQAPLEHDSSDSSESSMWQKLHRTWHMLQQSGGGGVVGGGLSMMQRGAFTTQSEVPAAQQLTLGRRDYVTSAWLRLRQQQQQQQQQQKQGGGGRAPKANAAGSGVDGGGGSGQCSSLQPDEVLQLSGKQLLQLLEQLTTTCLL